jgi:hypothetical protein
MLQSPNNLSGQSGQLHHAGHGPTTRDQLKHTSANSAGYPLRAMPSSLWDGSMPLQ